MHSITATAAVAIALAYFANAAPISPVPGLTELSAWETIFSDPNVNPEDYGLSQAEQRERYREDCHKVCGKVIQLIAKDGCDSDWKGYEKSCETCFYNRFIDGSEFREKWGNGLKKALGICGITVPEEIPKEMDADGCLVEKPSPAKPDAEKTATETPSAENPDSEKPDTVKPDTVKPDTVKPDTVKPDTVKPDTVKPDTVKPDTVKPDTVKPDTVKPDTVKPDTEKPPAGQSNTESKEGGVGQSTNPQEETSEYISEYNCHAACGGIITKGREGKCKELKEQFVPVCEKCAIRTGIWGIYKCGARAGARKCGVQVNPQ
ncbi:cell surface protein, partial [Metarhizium brunneum ARSEF 3297]